MDLSTSIPDCIVNLVECALDRYEQQEVPVYVNVHDRIVTIDIFRSAGHTRAAVTLLEKHTDSLLIGYPSAIRTVSDGLEPHAMSLFNALLGDNQVSTISKLKGGIGLVIIDAIGVTQTNLYTLLDLYNPTLIVLLGDVVVLDE